MRAKVLLVVSMLGVVAGFMPSASADCPQHLTHCSPGIVPPLANDPACVSPGKPPVILVHGTFADQTFFWMTYVPALRQAGYCPWTVDYGDRATEDMEVSVAQLTDFLLDTVLPTSTTGTVSLIGHSQGGLEIRHMLRHDPSLPIDDAISLSGSHYGTDTPAAGYAEDYGACPACGQQIQGSAWMTEHMNVGDPTPGSASYTQLETAYDEIVTPHENTFLPEEPGVVTNVLLQDACPQDVFEHVALTYDPFALDWALNALATPGPADPAHVPVGCIG